MLTHPRVSVSAMSSVRWSFEEDLALWRDLGLRWAGPLELELVGPQGDREGYGPVIRRGVCAAAAMLAEAGL